MAQHLKIADLTRLLRERHTSVDCRIAADWVEEHADHPAAREAVDRLESYFWRAGRDVADRAGIDMEKRAGLMDAEGRRGALRLALRVLVVLEAWEPGRGGSYFWHFADPVVFQVLVNHAQWVLKTRCPFWAGILTGRLRRQATGSI